MDRPKYDLCRVCGKVFKKNGVKKTCSKECSQYYSVEYRKSYYLSNKDKINQVSKEFRAKNKLKGREYSLAWRTRNHNDFVSRKREYNQKNREIQRKKAFFYVEECRVAYQEFANLGIVSPSAGSTEVIKMGALIRSEIKSISEGERNV